MEDQKTLPFKPRLVNTTPPADVTPPPDERIIALCEYLLVVAKSGRLRGIAFVTLEHDAVLRPNNPVDFATGFEITRRDYTSQALAGATVLASRITELVRSDTTTLPDEQLKIRMGRIQETTHVMPDSVTIVFPDGPDDCA